MAECPLLKIQIPLIFMKLKSYCRIFIWECIPIWLLLTWKNAESHLLSANWFDKSYFRVLIISHFSFLKHISIFLCSHVLDIKFTSIILDLLRNKNNYNEYITLLWWYIFNYMCLFGFLNKHCSMYVFIIFPKMLFTCILHANAANYVMDASIDKPTNLDKVSDNIWFKGSDTFTQNWHSFLLSYKNRYTFYNLHNC